jgi:hypothetical protein
MVSSVNESPPYCAPDSASVALAQQAGATNITSVETTHGVIRSVWPDKPFIYVTPSQTDCAIFRMKPPEFTRRSFPHRTTPASR